MKIKACIFLKSEYFVKYMCVVVGYHHRAYTKYPLPKKLKLTSRALPRTVLEHEATITSSEWLSCRLGKGSISGELKGEGAELIVYVGSSQISQPWRNKENASVLSPPFVLCQPIQTKPFH